MAKSLSPKRKKPASCATSPKNNPANSKSSSPTTVSVATRKKKKKMASADASSEIDYSGPTTPKRKSKVKEMQTSPSRSRSVKKKSSDVSIASDCSGPTTPKKKSKVNKVQPLPSHGRSGKSNRSSGHGKYREPTSPSDLTVTTTKGGTTPSPMATSSPTRSKLNRNSSPSRASDVSIASDCSGPTTPKKKSKVNKVQPLPSHGRSGKSNRSSGHGKYREPTSPSDLTVTTTKGGTTPSPMATSSPTRSKLNRNSSPSRVRKKLSTMHLNETTSPISKETSAPSSTEDSLKGKGTKPSVNHIDWTLKQDVMNALRYFFDECKYVEITTVEQIELLCGCYTPSEVRPIYFLYAVDSGIDKKDVDLSLCSSKKKGGESHVRTYC